MWNRQGEMEKGCVHPSKRADTQQALTRKAVISWKETELIFYLLTATFTVGPRLGCQRVETPVLTRSKVSVQG